MNRAIIVALFLVSTLTLSPLILISPQQHSVIASSEQLITYLTSAQQPIFVDLGNISENEMDGLKAILKSLPISKERISSFFTTQNKAELLKEELANLKVSITQLALSQVADLIQQSKDIVLSANIVSSAPRILQSQNFTGQVDSRIFINMSNYSASGLFVGLFLIVMLGIGLNVLFNLKTHERFARQNLWVGRQS